MTQVYALRLDSDLSDLSYQLLINKVDVEKRARIKKFLRREDALRCLFADLFIRYILIHGHGLKNEDISFGYADYGKPFCKGLDNFHFNISHSGEWIVCATGDNSVGIDIEFISSADLEIAESYFSKDERQQLFSLTPSEQHGLFFDLWICKESYLKLNGMGLSAPLDSFTISIDENRTVNIALETEMHTEVFFKQYDFDAKYKMAVCALGNSFGNIELLSLKDIELAFR